VGRGRRSCRGRGVDVVYLLSDGMCDVCLGDECVDVEDGAVSGAVEFECAGGVESVDSGGGGGGIIHWVGGVV